MARSGTYAFNLTIGDFLDSVLRLSGISGEGEVPSSAQYDIALEALNLTLHELEVNDVPLWKREEYTVKPNQSSYVTGSDTNVYRCITAHISTSDSEPGVGDLWPNYWYADDLPTGASAPAYADATAYITSRSVVIPTKYYQLLNARVTDQTGFGYELQVRPFTSYQTDTTAKWQSRIENVPNFVTLDNKLDNTLYIYPAPIYEFSSTLVLNFLVKPEDSVSNGDDIDIPQRYYQMLRYKVALEFSYQYQRNAEDIALILRQADYHEKKYRKDNRERTTSSMAKGCY